MPFTVKSYAAAANDAPLELYELERRDVLSDDVLIKIIYTGVCHSDIHVARDDWEGTTYPIIPGHEIVGEVEKIGSDVSKVNVGDIVAVGCMVDSCGECSMCHSSHEMFCEKGMIQTYNSPEGRRFPGHSTAGGYSQKIVVQQKFVLTVPKALQTKELLSGVAPILCAGITTYSPMRQYKVTKGTKVGIIGLGGLGHMGVKLANALGAEVTVISRSHKKDDHAKYLGAHKIVASTSEEEMKKAANSLDLVIDTIPFDHDVSEYMPLVAPFGNLCIVGQVGPLSKPINTTSLIFGNKCISGSIIGGIKETQELLELCGERKIIADHDVIRMEEINEAWGKMDRGEVANRFVIDTAKFQ